MEWQQARDLSFPQPGAKSDPGPVLLGDSLAVRRLRTQVQRIAPYLRTALILGEPGSGKSAVARELHRCGSNPDSPFVACRAMEFAEALFEERTPEDTISLLDSARGGTIYLSGVHELPYPLQGSLQRFLAERESARTTGGRLPSSTEVRIIAGSCRDLRTLSSMGQFRSELLSRLAVLEIRVPALHERTDDLPILAEWILARTSLRTGLPAKALSAAALESLQGREFGHNLRDFEQTVIHASALAEGPVIEPVHVPPPPRSEVQPGAEAPVPQPDPLKGERLQDVIHRHVLQILTRCRGNKLRTAEMLGISRSTLYRMLDSGDFVPQTAKRGG